jgi:hypothetical protein
MELIRAYLDLFVPRVPDVENADYKVVWLLGDSLNCRHYFKNNMWSLIDMDNLITRLRKRGIPHVQYERINDRTWELFNSFLHDCFPNYRI